MIFHGLQDHEREAQQKCCGQEDLQAQPVSGKQRVVRDRDSDAAGEQDGRIHGGQTDRRNSLKSTIGARPECPWAVARPRSVEIIPQQQPGEALHALAAQPRNGQIACIEQGTEERGKEHHFGKDEPHHSHAERSVHGHVVHAFLILADDGVKPENEQQRQHDETGNQRVGGQPVVERGDGARHQRKKRYGSIQGPRTAVRNVVFFRIRVRHDSISERCMETVV